MKTIDIYCKTWQSRKNKDHYFAAKIIIDFHMDTEKTVFIPFQSISWKENYLHEAKIALDIHSEYYMDEYCNKNNILLNGYKKQCTQRQCKNNLWW